MKKFIKSKKGLAALLATLTVVAFSAVGAFAFFTAGGSGTGSATVGNPSAIALSGSAVGTLYPGGAAVPVTVTIENNGSSAQLVGTVSGAVADNAGCLGSWFTVDSELYGAMLVAGDSDTVSTEVRMLESGTNQDACQGKTLTINWSSN